MTLLLFIGSVIFALAGFIFFSAARGAIHETAALVLFLTSAVMLVGATLNNAANRLIDLLRDRLPSAARVTRAATEDHQTESGAEDAEPPAPAPRETTPAAPPAAPKSWVEAAREELKAEKS